MAKALVLGGATGLLGKTLVRTLNDRGWETNTLGREEGDLLNPEFLRDRLEWYAPDVVVNTVAWTQVDAAEDDPDGAMAVNRSLPDALARIISGMPQVWLGQISTDFVFSGYHTEPFRETDTPNPCNTYGKTKLAGEQAVLSILPDRGCVIRTAWLFGPGRDNFVDKILNLSKTRDVLKVVDDQLGSPTYTVDAALWIAMLAENRATGIWHAVNSGQASWCELATEAVQLTPGLCRVLPIPSSQWPQKAKRPANSGLDNARLAEMLGKKPRCWHQALREHVLREYADARREP
ncbi:MAG: dTDP-4-dehydrorhamnose reductase [Desulfovibrio sp.]|nr:dTDP-4-dehydrorhamnose reductase [Desulfovibrio sp.]